MTDHSQTPPPGGTFTLAGRPVPRIGYGMGQLTRRAAAGGASGVEDAVALLRRAYDLGVRHFDTAQFYGGGLANSLLRQAFSAQRDEIVLATKAGAAPSDGPMPLTAAQRPHELRAAVEDNLATLGTDRLDVVNLRRMDFLPGLIAEGDQVVPLQAQLAELVALREEGKVVGIGISHITLEQLQAAVPVGLACVQNIYHLLGRADEPLLDLCRTHDIAWIPYFPLGGGGAYADIPKVTDDPVVREVAQALGATPTQVGLAWQLQHAPITMLIPGTGSVDHLLENTAAGELVIPADAMARLDALAPPAG
ncbi:aldo/keto reductase [Luteipulveratus sp. YIM 133132]|uniref:aldo/keto reductase n=1 Tax=Luteipulveratus flavus TaxID=3031728 RepID=UPI0023AEEE17|nr:aldo/keto reductase [Luteipulveratus sp. YIM 133132]MDE9364802.1 aldo/keto reductase [Luteipulveratus sp. YIM 133132]